MPWLNKVSKSVFLLGFLLLGLYVVTRLTNLTKLPVFTDEAIYIRWSQIGSHDASWRFISLTDGKQPLFTWIMMAVFKVSHDPLFAGRIVSVMAGFGSLIGIWILAYELFKKRQISFLASFLYLVSPFSLMYDRMALYDSLVATFSIWSLYLAVVMVRRLRVDISLILGITIGLGMLNKTSGFLSLYLLPVTLLFFDWREKGRWTRIGKWLLLVGVVVFLSQLMYGVLRLSPLSHMITQKDVLFVYPLSEWVNHPLRFLEGNLRGLFDWLWHYLTLPIFAVSCLPLFFLRKRHSTFVLLYMWWLLPFVALALFGRILYPRFILFMTMPLLLIVAYVIDWFWNNLRPFWLATSLIGLLFLPSIITDYYIIDDPVNAVIPESDKGQYINDWPAGWGIREVTMYLGEQAKFRKISVYTEGTFGLLPYALELYLVDNPHIKIHGIWPLPTDMPEEMISDARAVPTYFVLNQSQTTPLRWPLELISEYQKGSNTNRKLRFYRIKFPNAAYL